MVDVTFAKAYLRGVTDPWKSSSYCSSRYYDI